MGRRQRQSPVGVVARGSRSCAARPATRTPLNRLDLGAGACFGDAMISFVLGFVLGALTMTLIAFWLGRDEFR